MKAIAGISALALCLAPAAMASNGTVSGAAANVNGWFSADAPAPVAQAKGADPQNILGVTFFTTQAAFDNACGNPLTLEDFEDCGNGIIGCPGAPFDSNTNNACFPLCIAPGLILDAIGPSGNPGGNHQVYIGPAGFFGSVSKFVGADFFVDSMDWKFNPPVTAASVRRGRLIFNAGTVEVRAFGADYSTLLGTQNYSLGPNAGTFVGAIATGSDLIGRLNFYNTANNSEAGDEVAFGFCGPYCGDGNVDTPNGQGQNEECDPPSEEDHCTDECLIELYCGDGVVNQDCEACDDGNEVSADGCSCDCLLEGGGSQACDVVLLLTSPALPGAPALPSSHPCYEAPAPFGQPSADRSLR